MDVVPCPSHVSELIYCITDERLRQVPLSVKTGNTMAHHFSNNYRYGSQYAQFCVARMLVATNYNDKHWLAPAGGLFGLSEFDLTRGNAALAAFLHVTRQAVRTKSSNSEILSTLPQVDIRHTLPKLQHEFCALWNQIVLEARKNEIPSNMVPFLRALRHFYIALHEGTNAAPTAFRDSTPDVDSILGQPSSYPLCDIPSHRLNPSHDLTEHFSHPGPSVVSPPPLTISIPSQPISGEANTDYDSPPRSPITIYISRSSPAPTLPDDFSDDDFSSPTPDV